MRKFLATVVFLTGILSGCVTNKDYFEPFERVYGNIKYKVSKNYIQTPDETRKLRTGDCNDKALLLLDEWRKRGISGVIAGGKFKRDDEMGHSWCEVFYRGEEVIFDPTIGILIPRKCIDNLDLYIKSSELNFYEIENCMRKK